MASIKKLVPGQTIYDVKRNTGIAAFRSKYSTWPVYVVSVHHEEGYIIAKWNGNKEKKMSERAIKSFRLKEPK